MSRNPRAYSEWFNNLTTAQIKEVVRAHYVPFQSWADWGINPSKYHDREVRLRVTNDVATIMRELHVYYAAAPTLLPSNIMRSSSIFVMEDQSLVPRYYEELKSERSGLSLEGVINRIGELNGGDVLVIVSNHQPINPNGSFAKKYLEIVVVSHYIHKPPE
jgi:hypothetical protein